MLWERSCKGEGNMLREGHARERGLGIRKILAEERGTMHYRKHFPRERDLTFFLNFPLPFAGEESEGEGAILLPLPVSPSP